MAGDDPDEDDGPAAEHHVATLEEALSLAAEPYGADPDASSTRA